MRAIDADALLGKFSFYDGVRIPEKDIDGFLNTVSYHDVKDEIRKAPTIEPTANWTPCSVGLPTRLGHADWEIMEFICTISNGAVTPLEWEEKIVRGKTIKRWRWSNGRICEYAVLAWQPLPEPYRGEA